MSEEKRFIKNKKVFALSISLVVMCITAGVLGMSLLTIDNKYNDLSGDYDELYVDYLELLDDFNSLTLTQIETPCNADTYVSDMEPDTNFGNEQYWYAGEDEFTWEYFVAFFNFSLLDKPEIYEKVEIQLSVLWFEEGICYPVKFFQDWDESTITYNTMVQPDPDFLSFLFYYDLTSYNFNMIIDVTEWVNTGVDSLSIAVLGGGYYEGYSREHPNQDMVPKLIWTIIGASI